MSADVVEAESLPSLITRMAGDLQKNIAAVLDRKERFTWVLSGGSTPRRLYEALTQQPYRSTIPWERLWVFWGDERAVPPTDPESNFHMAQDALLRHVPIPADHIFRIKAELPPARAARDYEDRLRIVLGATLPAFDLVLLGMGPDGHTASLFPGTPALANRDRWVIENPVDALHTTRLTLTLPVLNNAREVWFLATGADKAQAYAHVRAAPDAHYPASLIAPREGTLRWYIDSAISANPK